MIIVLLLVTIIKLFSLLRVLLFCMRNVLGWLETRLSSLFHVFIAVPVKNDPLMAAFALQPCTRNRSPAPDWVLFKLILPRVLFSGDTDTGMFVSLFINHIHVLLLPVPTLVACHLLYCFFRRHRYVCWPGRQSLPRDRECLR